MRNELSLTICHSIIMLCMLMSNSFTPSIDLQLIEPRRENILIVEEHRIADDPQTLTLDRWVDAFSYDSWSAVRTPRTGIYGTPLEGQASFCTNC